MSEYEYVNARPISVAEIMAMAEGEVESAEVYVPRGTARHGVTLDRATLTLSGNTLARKRQIDAENEAEVASRPRSKRGHTFAARAAASPVYARKPAPTEREPERTVADVEAGPIGYDVKFSHATEYGIESGFTLTTVPDAVAGGANDVRAERMGAEGIAQCYVADERGSAMRLTPDYGSQMTLGVTIKGVDHVAALARAEAVLRAEFGDALTLHKGLTRPVPDVRVDVLRSTADGEVPVAVNVLAADAHHYAKSSVFATRETDPDMVIG